MKIESITTETVPHPVGLYPHAKRVGNLLFLSGLGPREPDGKTIPGAEYDNNGQVCNYDFEAQCHSVFRNIARVLEEAGSEWDNIVDITVFLTNMKADFPTFNRIYAEYFANHQPARTTVEVLSLPTQIAVELKCIAVIDKEKV